MQLIFSMKKFLIYSTVKPHLAVTYDIAISTDSPKIFANTL